VVAQLDTDEGFPVNTGGSLQRSYEITPLLTDNRDKRGLALDGQIKHEDTCLASSTILPPGVDETRENREKMGIMVHYNVKVRCIVAFGSDLTLELPFTLTHPKPKEPVISQMVTLPPLTPAKEKKPAAEEGKEGEEGPQKGDVQEEESAGATAVLAHRPSVHDAIDHNLITFDTNGSEPDDQDFVFEEFVRLRVAGTEEVNNETEA